MSDENLTPREKIIQRLLRAEQITEEEAAVLLKEPDPKVVKEIQFIPMPRPISPLPPIAPYPTVPKSPFSPVNPWAPKPVQPFQADPFDYFESCGCNPKNGGSGLCGCVLGTRTIYSTSTNKTT
jgi:hypothetical protein